MIFKFGVSNKCLKIMYIGSNSIILWKSRIIVNYAIIVFAKDRLPCQLGFWSDRNNNKFVNTGKYRVRNNKLWIIVESATQKC